MNPLDLLIEQALNKPIIYVGSPLRPQPGDPGWPVGHDADRLSGKCYRAEPLTCYDAGLAANLALAEELCKSVALAGGVPYAPHLLFPRFFDDRNAVERDLSILCGLRMISICDEAWFKVPTYRDAASKGMKGEIDASAKLRVNAHVAYTDTTWRLNLDRLTKGQIVPRRAA